MPAAFRLAGLSEAIRTAFPDGGVALYHAVTTLGDPAFLTVGLAVLYWVAADRRAATARVVAYGFTGFAVVVALKSGFALPRPPEAVWLITTDGFGFPSGHAIGAVVIYGGLATEYGWDEDARKLAGAVGLIVAIALSRVVLGVHYLGDILAGIVIGFVVLVVARAIVAEDISRAFGLGLLASVPALFVTTGGATALGIAGACLGGLAAAIWFDRVPTAQTHLHLLVLLVVGVPLVIAIQLAEPLVAPLPFGPGIDDAVLVASVLLLPAGIETVGRQLSRR